MKALIFMRLFLALFARIQVTQSTGKYIFNKNWDGLDTSYVKTTNIILT